MNLALKSSRGKRLLAKLLQPSVLKRKRSLGSTLYTSMIISRCFGYLHSVKEIFYIIHPESRDATRNFDTKKIYYHNTHK